MTVAQAAPITSSPLLVSPTANRLASIDALRGFVMFAMLFVNDVAGVPAAPWWMKHFHPDNANGMTFVDLVFPAFLFIVGLSIPLATERRLQRAHRDNPRATPQRSEAQLRDLLSLIPHILLRTASLLFLGVFMVNTNPDPSRMPYSPAMWTFLVYLFAILAFIDLPRASPTIILRTLAFAGFACLYLTYRDTQGHRMTTQWWGILGLIGWAYLVASILYLIFRRHREALVGCIAILTSLYIAERLGRFDRWPISNYINIGEHLGAHGSIAMAGVVLATILTDPTKRLPQQWIYAAIYGLALAIFGQLLYRLYGINKNAATPTWCLWASAITTWLWILFSITMTTLGPRPFNFLIKAGQNVLLAYLLAPLWHTALRLLHINWYNELAAHSAALGITRALIGAALTLYVATLLNQNRIRLKL